MTHNVKQALLAMSIIILSCIFGALFVSITKPNAQSLDTDTLAYQVQLNHWITAIQYEYDNVDAITAGQLKGHSIAQSLTTLQSISFDMKVITPPVKYNTIHLLVKSSVDNYTDAITYALHGNQFMAQIYFDKSNRDWKHAKTLLNE